MERTVLNKNALDKKLSRACPMPSALPRTRKLASSHLQRSWITKNYLSLYYLITLIAGVVLIITATFIPPVVAIHEISTGSGSYIFISTFSVISSVIIPFLSSIGLGIAAAACIPITYYHNFRHRFGGAIIFAILYATAYYIDLTNLSRSYNAIATSYGLTQHDYLLQWAASPLLFLYVVSSIIVVFGSLSVITIILSSYFTEYIWTSLKSTVHIDPKTRRTAVWIHGGTRGTVISVNHKGGYTRGFTRPSKWQAYDRKD